MSNIRILIVDDKHPHVGETGYIPVVNDEITFIALPGSNKADMFEIILDNCPHGTRGCFAKQSQVKLLKK